LVILVLLELRVIKEDRVHRQSGHKDRQEIRELKVHRQLVILVLLELKVTKEDKVHRQLELKDL
jgi:hypothetical protein